MTAHEPDVCRSIRAARHGHDAPAPRARPERTLTGRTVLAMLLAFFGVVMLVNFAMVKAAVSTFGGVDTLSSYQAGLAFKAEEARLEAQRKREWRVNEHLAAEGATQTLTVTIADKSGEAVSGMDVVARLAHPIDERRDQVIALKEVMPGTYRADASPPAGVWRLDLTVTKSGEQLFRSQNRIVIP